MNWGNCLWWPSSGCLSLSKLFFHFTNFHSYFQNPCSVRRSVAIEARCTALQSVRWSWNCPPVLRKHSLTNPGWALEFQIKARYNPSMCLSNIPRTSETSYRSLLKLCATQLCTRIHNSFQNSRDINSALPPRGKTKQKNAQGKTVLCIDAQYVRPQRLSELYLFAEYIMCVSICPNRQYTQEPLL